MIGVSLVAALVALMPGGLAAPPAVSQSVVAAPVAASGSAALPPQSGATGRESLGIFQSWGAFRDAAPARCYAISRTVQRRPNAFASIATWPRSGVRNQFHVRLSRARDPRARVTLAIGERRFELIAGASDAWAPDAQTDRAILAAIRSARSMSVESVARGGGPFADLYALKGAATAVDAAVLSCARR